MSKQLQDFQYEQALAALESEDFSPTEKVEMLMEIAMGLQSRPKNQQQLLNAIVLYDRALAGCPPEEYLLTARVRARKATALQMVPGEELENLLQARTELEQALPILEEHGLPAELAEARLNLGLILQSLVPFNQARITEAIDTYQKALRTFSAKDYPTEFAILHNNLATAFLSIPMSDERGKMREALAVQSFQAALEVVTLEEHPNEYAMLQNNLGNALQYASSAHAVENNLRALEAYDEALKVRTLQSAPSAYANTIANKANCLLNLPDDPENPEKGNRKRLVEAQALYKEARDIFASLAETSKIPVVEQAISNIEEDLNQ